MEKSDTKHWQRLEAALEKFAREPMELLGDDARDHYEKVLGDDFDKTWYTQRIEKFYEDVQKASTEMLKDPQQEYYRQQNQQTAKSPFQGYRGRHQMSGRKNPFAAQNK
jgi:Zn-dependent M32 family carboxypeptidase